MSLLVEVIKEDLKLAKKHIDDKNFEFINIIGNRMMSNQLVADENEKILIMVGWILREMGGELTLIKAFKNEPKISNAITVAKESVDKLSSMIAKKGYTAKEFWELYFDYQNKIRGHLLPKPDDTIYTKKPEFTRKINLMLVKHFSDNKKLLLQENNNLTKGIITELTRVVNEYSAKEADFITYIIFKAFDRYYDYALYSETNLDGKIRDKEALESKLSPFLEKLDKIVALTADNLEESYKSSTDLIYELSMEYRKYYINYSEIYIPTIKKKIELPEEAKTKIGDAIAKAFEEETV